MPHLTKRFVDALRADPDGRDVTHWDSDHRDALPRFGVRVKASGTRSWVIQYRNEHGRLRKYTLGRVGTMTPEEARAQARGLLVDIARDKADPAEKKRMDRNAMTVAELCDEHLEASEGRIKASTLVMDKSRISRHVKPLLGSRPVKSLTPTDIEKFMRSIAGGKTAEKVTKGKRPRGGIAKGGAGVASRTVSMLGTILERAVRDRTISVNPVRGVARPKDKARKPPFSFEHVAALGEAMRAAEAAGEKKTALRAIRLLLATGCRRSEILALKWSEVDENAKCIRFADTKSGPQVRPIGEGVLQILRDEVRSRDEKAKSSASPPTQVRLPKDATYVLPSMTNAEGHFVGLPKSWGRVADRAQLTNMPIHGLRHWFASAAAEMNFSELTIAGLLGHSAKGVTARYATTPDSALVAAADKVSARLIAALDGVDTDEAADTNVVPMKKRKRA